MNGSHPTPEESNNSGSLSAVQKSVTPLKMKITSSMMLSILSMGIKRPISSLETQGSLTTLHLF
jgi:hypothetical protein